MVTVQSVLAAPNIALSMKILVVLQTSPRIEGMPFDVEDIPNAFVIIDDLMNEVGDDKRTFKLVHERKPS
ncbi:hypothetical protein TNCV_3010851 [Trichonephila clavipes]|nr:hypothetical protein TNCV_3010851 [Trichonephila clavipes]